MKETSGEKASFRVHAGEKMLERNASLVLMEAKSSAVNLIV